MATQLPLWYGKPRGTAISSVVALEAHSAEQPEFLSSLGDRLFHLVDGSSAAVLGFLVTCMPLALIAAALAPVSSAGCALAALVTVGWCLTCGWAGVDVYSNDEEAPPWARALAEALTVIGRLAAAAFVIASILLLLALVLSIVTAASGAGRNH